MLDEEPLFTPLTIEKIAENAQKSKEWNMKVKNWQSGIPAAICLHNIPLIGGMNVPNPQ